MSERYSRRLHIYTASIAGHTTFKEMIALLDLDMFYRKLGLVVYAPERS